MMMPNAPGAAISMRYGLQGPNETITTACAASTHAIGYAARLIAWGMCDAVVTGGTESAGCPIGVASFGNMTALSTTGSSRPFDVDRDGFVLGEGAAVLILEEWESAEARGANICGEVLGAASNADAYHITAPSPGGVGAIACMRLALDDAGLDACRHRPRQCPRNLHATERRGRGRRRHRGLRPGGCAGDLDQGGDGSRPRRRRCPRGRRPCSWPWSTARSHPRPAPPRSIPTFTIDLVVDSARPWTPGPAMSNSLGFGGHNGSIIFGPA